MYGTITVKEFKVAAGQLHVVLQSLQEYVGEAFCSGRVLSLLERSLSGEISLFRLEEPYVDKDFRDLYYSDFSKRFKEVSRDSKRVHLYLGARRQYAGFFTLHNVSPCNIGRSCISPDAMGAGGTFLCLSDYKVNFCGEELHVRAFPWMQQDVNMSRCAHVAVWEIIRYFSQRKSNYREILLGEIDRMSDKPQRKVPSSGLTISEVARCLAHYGFSVNIHSKEVLAKSKNYKGCDFYQLLFSYIESGIPVIASFKKRPHAIVIMGHGPVASAASYRSRIIPSYKLCRELVSCDDNKMPYSRLDIQGKDEGQDLSCIVVPLYEKMYIDLFSFISVILPEFERENITSKTGGQYVRRVFITSSNALKRFVRQNSGDEDYIKYTGRLLMPKFVIVAEYALLAEYPKQVRCRLIFDATALEKQSFKDNYICVKSEDSLTIRAISSTLKLKSKTEPLYVNNLQGT